MLNKPNLTLTLIYLNPNLTWTLSGWGIGVANSAIKSKVNKQQDPNFHMHYVVVSLGKTLNAKFLTGSLCGVEKQHRGLFHNGIYTGDNTKTTSGHGTAGISESGSG